MVNFEDYLIRPVDGSDYMEFKRRYLDGLRRSTKVECENLPFSLSLRYNSNAKAIGIHITRGKRTYLAGTEGFAMDGDERLVDMLKNIVDERIKAIKMIKGPWTE